MTGTSADDALPPAARSTAARRRSAGIYGTIVASAVLAAGGAKLGTVPLAVTALVTLLVYWAAEAYAELLSEQIHAGYLPTRGQLRASLVAIWPMVSASFIPLLTLLGARVLRPPRRRPPWRWWWPSGCCWSTAGSGKGGPAPRPAIVGGDADRGGVWGHDDPAQTGRHPLMLGTYW